MAGSLNKVMVIGNVGRDPEMRYTASGVATATFSVAASRRWTGNDGEAHEDTEWFRVVAWDKLAERCSEMVTKGRKVYVEGRLQTRQWVDRENQKRYTTEVVAHTVLMLDSRPVAPSGPEGGFPEDGVEPDDIPF